MSDKRGRQRDRENKMEYTLPPLLCIHLPCPVGHTDGVGQDGRVLQKCADPGELGITAGSCGDWLSLSVPLLTELEEAPLFF